jgi:hypothetical protein
MAATRKSVTRLPLEALVSANNADGKTETKPDNKKTTLDVRSKSKGKWEKREVAIGVMSFAFAEIISGLKPGEEVLVSLAQPKGGTNSN